MGTKEGGKGAGEEEEEEGDLGWAQSAGGQILTLPLVIPGL